jgi:hypothetical protein
MCGRRLASLYIMCTFGIQVWELALCYIMWIRPSFRDGEYNVYGIFLYKLHVVLTIFMKLYVTWPMWPKRHIPQTFDFVAFRLMKNIIFNKIESFVERKTSEYACQMFCSKCNCETMHHWCVLLEITVVKILNNLNVFSAHCYLYPRSPFKPKQKPNVTIWRKEHY